MSNKSFFIDVRKKKRKRLERIDKEWICSKSKFVRTYFEEMRIASLTRYDKETLELKEKNLIAKDDMYEIVSFLFLFSSLKGKE